MKTLVTWMIIASSVPFLTGCEGLANHTLTGHLWQEQTAPVHYAPSTPPNLELYTDFQHGDILVEYDELSDKTGRVKRRAYLLDANEERILAAKKPRFVDVHTADHLAIIPVGTNSAPGADSTNNILIRAELSPDGLQFTLISVGQSIGPHRLPIYTGSADHFDRFMFTPMTVTGDVVVYSAMVGAVAGVVYVYALAESGTTFK
jgi:hypothetical protein